MEEELTHSEKDKKAWETINLEMAYRQKFYARVIKEKERLKDTNQVMNIDQIYNDVFQELMIVQALKSKDLFIDKLTKSVTHRTN